MDKLSACNVGYFSMALENKLVNYECHKHTALIERYSVLQLGLHVYIQKNVPYKTQKHKEKT